MTVSFASTRPGAREGDCEAAARRCVAAPHSGPHSGPGASSHDAAPPPEAAEGPGLGGLGGPDGAAR